MLKQQKSLIDLRSGANRSLFYLSGSSLRVIITTTTIIIITIDSIITIIITIIIIIFIIIPPSPSQSCWIC